jgi:hypothetical protein
VNLSKEQVKSKLRKLAKKLGTDTIKQEDIKKAGFYYQVQKNFRRTSTAIKEAGLKPSRLGKAMATSDEELKEHIRYLNKKLGSPPTIMDLRREGKYSDKIYETRFGSFPEARALALGESPPASLNIKQKQLDSLNIDYIGRAGEMYVISELLYQYFNANLALIDTGVDVIATKKDKTFYFQVKNVSFKNTNVRTIPITKSSFINNQKGNMYYMFVLQENETKRVLILPYQNIHQYIQQEIIQFDEQARKFSITISIADNKVKIKSASDTQRDSDVTHMVEDWDVIV